MLENAGFIFKCYKENAIKRTLVLAYIIKNVKASLVDAGSILKIKVRWRVGLFCQYKVILRTFTYTCILIF